jgi:hypothetical protein
VFIHHSRRSVAHFRTAHFLSLFHLQEVSVLSFFVSWSQASKAQHFVSGGISSPEDFLKAIGRGSEKKISFDTWDALWKTTGPALKKAGLAVRDRRCVRRVPKALGR